jgi:ATP-dependent DNA helicase RecG
LNEEYLFSLEERIAGLIHDLCEPVIIPEITLLQHEGKHIIRTQIYKGSAPPYHLKIKRYQMVLLFVLVPLIV